MSFDIQQVIIDALTPYAHDKVLADNLDDDTFKEEDLSDNEVYWSAVSNVLREWLHETAEGLSDEADPYRCVHCRDQITILRFDSESG